MEGKISPFQELNQNNWPTMKVMSCECVWQFIFNKQLTIMQIVLGWKKHNYGSRRLNVQMTFKWFVTSYLMLHQLHRAKQSKEKNSSSLFLFKWSFSKKSHEVYCFVWQDCPHHTECPLTWPACAHFLCIQSGCLLMIHKPWTKPKQIEFNTQGREYKFNRKSANARHSIWKFQLVISRKIFLLLPFIKKNPLKREKSTQNAPDFAGRNEQITFFTSQCFHEPQACICV